MKSAQVKNSALLVFSNLSIHVTNFLKQVIMAYCLGVSEVIDTFLLAQILPTIIQAMISGGAGEILVIRKEKVNNSIFETFYIFLLLMLIIILGIATYFSLSIFIPFFDLDGSRTEMFISFSLLFIINMIPGVFVSVLRPQLYAKGLYKFYTYSSLISQIVGLLIILVTVKHYGIYSFAYGIIGTNILNAIWFLFKAQLQPKVIFSINSWKTELSELNSMFKKIFSLSIQTFFNHLGTFWERSLSVKYLSGGYLSALNYSKNLSDMPNTVVLSSVLTTSYIEQVNLYKQDITAFQVYTSRIYKMLIKAGFLFQIAMLAFAPILIIVLFRRGKFDNNAVEITMVIFSILTISFLPKLLMSYLTRTMYILGEYNKLLIATILKFVVQFIVMIVFIRSVSHSIPIAILAGNLFICFYLLLLAKKKIELPSHTFLIVRLLAATIFSFVMLQVHIMLLPLYIERSTFFILLLYSPLMIIGAVVMFLYMKKLGLTDAVLKKLKLKASIS